MKRILAAVDFSPVTGDLIRVVAALSRAFHADVRLIHAVPPEPDFVGYEAGPATVRERIAAEYRAARQQLHAIEESLRDETPAVSALVVQGDPVQKILAAAQEFGADLLVMGSHGHGALYDLLVGSVASGVLKHARCPVLVVPSRRPT
ncbi:MAG: universal stress protein [Kiritimatiellae bacterium]|nr:universal stress protein [Kiritimatiellia bacterium]